MASIANASITDLRVMCNWYLQLIIIVHVPAQGRVYKQLHDTSIFLTKLKQHVFSARIHALPTFKPLRDNARLAALPSWPFHWRVCRRWIWRVALSSLQVGHERECARRQRPRRVVQHQHLARDSSHILGRLALERVWYAERHSR